MEPLFWLNSLASEIWNRNPGPRARAAGILPPKPSPTSQVSFSVQH